MDALPQLDPPLDTRRGNSRDRLTILRVMLLTAGVACGLTVFAPPVKQDSLRAAEWWLVLANSFVIGLSLPAPLFTLRFRRTATTVGHGGLFALMASLGVLLLLPPAIFERMASSDRTSVQFCLYYVLPLSSLWFLLACLLTGGIRGWRAPETPWTDRYGLFLALLWAPLGIWHTVRFYIEAWPSWLLP